MQIVSLKILLNAHSGALQIRRTLLHQDSLLQEFRLAHHILGYPCRYLKREFLSLLGYLQRVDNDYRSCEISREKPQEYSQILLQRE